MRQAFDFQIAVQYLVMMGTGDSATRQWATLSGLDQAAKRLIAHHGQAFHVRRQAMGWPATEVIEQPTARRPATTFSTILEQRTPELQAALPHTITPTISPNTQAEIGAIPLRRGSSTSRVLSAAKKTQAAATNVMHSLARTVRSASKSGPATGGGRMPSFSLRAQTSHGERSHTTHETHPTRPEESISRPAALECTQTSFPVNTPGTTTTNNAPELRRTPRVRRGSGIKRMLSDSVRSRTGSRSSSSDVDSIRAEYLKAARQQESAQATASTPPQTIRRKPVGSATRPQTASSSSNSSTPPSSYRQPRGVRFNP